jgi:hypothetical protein
MTQRITREQYLQGCDKLGRKPAKLAMDAAPGTDFRWGFAPWLMCTLPLHKVGEDPKFGIAGFCGWPISEEEIPENARVLLKSGVK